MITTPSTTGADRNVRTVADHIEITDLVHRLGVNLDEARFDDIAELLVADATVRTPGGRAEGRDAVIGQATRNHPADQRFQHVITNVLIDLSGDRATVRANLVVHITGVDEPPTDAPAPQLRCSIGEVYNFEFIRTRDGWRFTHIETVPLWIAGSLPTRPDLED